MIGTPELILILIAALFLFGPEKLPELARTLGKISGEFRKAQNEVEQEFKKAQMETDQITGEFRKTQKEIEQEFKKAPETGKKSDQILNEKDRRIHLQAIDMGINIQNKTTEELEKEIAKIKEGLPTKSKQEMKQ